ncbi:MAG: hypothetical protein ACYSWZ_12375 [Planctomycetota bacterium]|jgi:hypothetical protein
MCGTTNPTKILSALSALICLLLFPGCAVNETYVSSGSQMGGSIVIRVASSQNSDPFQAGKQAAKALRERMGQVPPHTVVLTEYFEDQAQKKEVLKGVRTVFPADIVFGFATYGSFNNLRFIQPAGMYGWRFRWYHGYWGRGNRHRGGA